MPLVADILAAALAGVLALVAAATFTRATSVPARPALETSRRAGEAVRHSPWLRRHLRGRLDPATATGLLLTLALAMAVLAGIVLAVLAYVVRSVAALQDLDDSVAQWGNDHRTQASTDGLRLITSLGATWVVILLALVVVAVDMLRTRRLASVGFMLVLLAGQWVLSTTVKDLADRVRPTFDPIAATLGPSFPSGHSSTSAAFYAGAALVLGRGLVRWQRIGLSGIAVSVAVAVAGSRVLLDLHWLSDVFGGLALGWGWFALTGIAFGGRLLRPTAAVETAMSEAAGG